MACRKIHISTVPHMSHSYLWNTRQCKQIKCDWKGIGFCSEVKLKREVAVTLLIIRFIIFLAIVNINRLVSKSVHTCMAPSINLSHSLKIRFISYIYFHIIYTGPLRTGRERPGRRLQTALSGRLLVPGCRDLELHRGRWGPWEGGGGRRRRGGGCDAHSTLM